MSDFIKPVNGQPVADGSNVEVVDFTERDASAAAGDTAREPLRDVSADAGGQPLPAPDHDARQAAIDAPKRERIAELQLEHRDLDDVIERLADQPGVDDLRLRRLKKRKLQIRDSLERLQMSITPDIPA
ncbi:DUF465 domain-containing protein [Pigmentiphaga aceris]|uniref:DUF465 domain-containing protein n=1 Tax=Pigmentiphaga aceris TaxID=1940612 RepID=A0A5C0AUT6_9BURK|nr:DUF465 domain-containing protein [Pigmentiphaga aceris]